MRGHTFTTEPRAWFRQADEPWFKLSWRPSTGRWELTRREGFSVLLLTVCLIVQAAIAPCGHAQIVTTAITPTTGVGNLGTTVTQNGHVFNIGGGTRPGNGPNLFQSFGLFSVGGGDTANFQNTMGLPTQNILSRVTGGQPSNIFGTLQTTGFGNANLFLMNPAGIVFGPTASLNVAGSVNFTTADYLRLAYQTGGNPGIFYANPGLSSVLSIAPVAAFGFLSPNPAPITVQGSTLTTAAGQTISFVSGDVTFAADPGTGAPATIQAPGGQIQVVSVASPGEVLTPSLNFGPNINGQTFTTLGTVTVQGGSTLDVSDFGFAGNGSAGSIFIRAGQLVMDSGFITAEHLSDTDAPSPAIKIVLDQDLVMRNFSVLDAESFALGRSGDINVSARNITLTDGSFISTAANGPGNTGDIILHAYDSITFQGFLDPADVSSAFSFGGAISIKARSLTLDNLGAVRSSIGSNGAVGDISVTVANLTMSGGQMALSGNGQSPSQITINAQDTVNLAAPGPQAFSATTIGVSNVNTGGLTIQAQNVTLNNAAQIQLHNDAPNLPGQGQPTLTIHATDTLALLGNGQPLGSNTLISTSSGATSPAGVIDLSARSIMMTDGAQVFSQSGSNQPAGVVSLQAESISLTNSSGISTSTTQGIGQGGSIEVTAQQSLTMSGGAQLASNSFATGPAGTLSVNAGNLVSLSGSGTAITSTASGAGAGGSIQVQAASVQLSDSAAISAASTGTGNAGTVNIQTSGNFVSSGGTVSTSASQATGGNITLNVGQQVQLSNGALISASSQGLGNAGDILVSAGDSILMNASTISTAATQASGGNITLTAPNLIQLTGSQITSSVQGGSQTVGGNITIDPQFLILQNSKIIAQAVEGQGGNINITAGVFLADSSSVVDASSQTGINGSVVIQSPISNLSQIVAPLQKSTLQATAFLLERCAVRAQSGTLSSLTVRTRDVAPAAPGGMLSGPLLSLGPSPGAGGASQPAVQESVVPKPPLLEMSGELLRPMGGWWEGQLRGCGS